MSKIEKIKGIYTSSEIISKVNELIDAHNSNPTDSRVKKLVVKYVNEINTLDNRLSVYDSLHSFAKELLSSSDSEILNK